MARLLSPVWLITPCLLLAAGAASAELSDRHEFRIALDRNIARADSNLGAWPTGGFGKLRYSERGAVRDSLRLSVDYTGRVAPTLFGHAVLDYLDDAEIKLGLTEAYLEWRPVPRGPNRHRFRFGAFYPPFSLENTRDAWESPYARSFSAINTWLGEEIRPIGAEWRLARPLGSAATGREFSSFVGVFYGNDPAATLLFWRGWAVHDRQTRLNERLPLPPLVLPSQGNRPASAISRRLDPIAEIDDRPGYYAGAEWRQAGRAKLALGYFDNRGDPYAFRDGQWAWDTRFWHLGAEVSLPGNFGIIVQHLGGSTDWLTYVTPTGATTPATVLVRDGFEASFLMLTRTIAEAHRLSLRADDFQIRRAGGLEADRGHAISLAYDWSVNRRLRLELEWMSIDSRRDLWPLFYGQVDSAHRESLAQVGFNLVLFDNRN